MKLHLRSTLMLLIKLPLRSRYNNLIRIRKSSLIFTDLLIVSKDPFILVTS